VEKINENIFCINNFFSLHDTIYNFIINNKNKLNFQRYENSLDINSPNAYKMSYIMIDNNLPELKDIFISLQKQTQNAVKEIWGGSHYCHWQDTSYLGSINIYEKGDYQMDHNDFHNNKEPMKYSCVYYVNEDYEGGNLSFPDLDITFKPKKNSLVLFLSKLNHRSEIIISGQKIISAFFYRNIVKAATI